MPFILATNAFYMSTQIPEASQTYFDIDLALSQIGDLDSLNSMLLMLQESLTSDLPKIASLLQQGDVPAANRLLHALKGFIPIFCRESLCSHVVRVEGLSKLGPSAALVPAYAALQPELAQLLCEVTSHLSAHGFAT